MNEVELYKQGGEENVYEWVKRRNMEHVVCRRFMKEEVAISDLHNLYIANSKENSIRNDMPFHYQKPRTFQKGYYVKEKKDQIAILASIAYISFMYPNLYQKYFMKMITIETFYEWMYKNPHITEELIKRNEQIYQIQGNRNPFLQYPFLYQIMFEEDWSDIRWIENIKAFYWSYKWRMIYAIHPLSFNSERTSSGVSFCNK
jgi:endonuclease I